MSSMNMYTSKKTIKTFVILIVTFIQLLGIAFLANQVMLSNKGETNAKLTIMIQENLESGMSYEKALEKTISDNPGLAYTMAKDASSNGRVIIVASLAAVIILLYLSSVTITYFTREE